MRWRSSLVEQSIGDVLGGRDLPPPLLGLTVTVAVAISTIGNSAWLIGADCMIVNEAGYVIVNELALTRRAVERTRIPAGLADLIHRALAARLVRGGSSSRRDSKYVENGVRHSLRKAYCRMLRRNQQ
jgi:hypothetical protein